MLLKYLVQGGDYPGSGMLVCADELEVGREAVDIELMIDICARLVKILFHTKIVPVKVMIKVDREGERHIYTHTHREREK